MDTLQKLAAKNRLTRSLRQRAVPMYKQAQWIAAVKNAIGGAAKAIGAARVPTAVLGMKLPGALAGRSLGGLGRTAGKWIGKNKIPLGVGTGTGLLVGKMTGGD